MTRLRLELRTSVVSTGQGPGSLAGKRILVTGAGGGIGTVICATLQARGAKVIALDRDPKRLASLARKQRGLLATVSADLTDSEQLANVLAETQKRWGIFSNLVNTAAYIYDIGSLKGMTPAIWRAEIEANLNSVYNATSALLPSLIKRKGSIVTIGSVNALTSIGHPAYSAAKAGLVSYCRAVAMEYGCHGVRCNVVQPGTVATPVWRKRVQKDPDIFKKLVRWYPLGRTVKPTEIATAVSFLLSADASAISGAVLNVDCGLMAGNLPFATELTGKDMS